MSSNSSLFLPLVFIVYFSQWKCAHCVSKRLSEIRYHFTPCGSTGYTGPTFDQCETYYMKNASPIATDEVLFPFDEEGFRGGQGFRIPRNDVYNVTIAGAAGGRGLCNIHFGLGRTTQFQVRLTTDYELLVMVGQKGQSPCDNLPNHILCQDPPTDMDTAARCNRSWSELTGSNADSLLYKYDGGAGGGGASMLRARNIENGNLLFAPIAVTGGGGGTSAVLNYIDMANLIRDRTFESTDELPTRLLYTYHINARLFPSTDIEGGRNASRGYRPLSILSFLSGAGGGWTSSLLSSSITDGKQISQRAEFAEGGLDCDRLFGMVGLFREVEGGFGGGGGECGGGGGGGGYTGGAVLGYNNDIVGGGGYSVIFNATQTLPILSLLGHFFNDGDGYVDIILANCNCTGTCAVNETEDSFECFCPSDSTPALDDFDCYWEVNATVLKTMEQLESSGYLLQGLPFANNSAIELFSVKVTLTVEQGSECGLVFLDKDKIPVLATAPLRETGSVNLIASLNYAEDFTIVTLSEYTNELTSAVETIGAVLVTNGRCFLHETSIATNVSIRPFLSEEINTDFEEIYSDIVIIASQVLQLPITTQLQPTQTTTNPNSRAETFDGKGLLIGLVLTIILLLLVVIVAIVIVIWYRISRSKKEVTINSTQVHHIEGVEPTAYAELRIETRQMECSYSKLEDIELKSEPVKRYHTLEHKREEFFSQSVKDEGYEVLKYDDDEVVHAMTTTLSGTTLPPLYGIIPPTHDFTQYNRERSTSAVVDWQYPRNKLIYIRELGEGQFGKVLLMKAQGIAGYKGKIPVAVKTLTSRDPTVISKFMEEAEMMKKFSHPNIVSMLGISSESEDDDEDSAPLMILEYMPYGDLQGFLEKHKPDNSGQTCVKEKQFHKFARDIALALDFLAENHYVHRDVAARNCLVSTDLHIKLADFGLSREIYEKDYYKVAGKAMLPVRWMAPECLIYGIFTTAGDVWSYGVVLWEIASYGDSPLEEMEAKDVVEAAQNESLHHPRPEKCPDYLYDLMSKCHIHEASERPSFSEILTTLAREVEPAAALYEIPATNGTYDVPPDAKD